MPNEHETLTELFTDIADAIREKTGETATIKADDFPAAIADIETSGGGITPTGTITITENGTHDVTQYASALVNVAGGGGGLPSGITAIDCGSFTVETSIVTKDKTISHNLNTLPKGLVLWVPNLETSTTIEKDTIMVYIATNVASYSNAGYYAGRVLKATGSIGSFGGNFSDEEAREHFTTEYFKLTQTSRYYVPNITYNWIAWA